MFSSEAQRARACRALCARARIPWMWTERGPTDEAMQIMERNGGALSSGERVVALAAWAFWNGHDGVSLADVVERLDGGNLRAVAGLMTALASGGTAIEEWIVRVENDLRREHVRR